MRPCAVNFGRTLGAACHTQQLRRTARSSSSNSSSSSSKRDHLCSRLSSHMHSTTRVCEYAHGLSVGCALKRRGTGANGLACGFKKHTKTASSSSSSSPSPSPPRCSLEVYWCRLPLRLCRLLLHRGHSVEARARVILPSNSPVAVIACHRFWSMYSTPLPNATE